MGVSTSLVNGLLGIHHSFQTGGFFIAHYSEIIRFATPSKVILVTVLNSEVWIVLLEVANTAVNLVRGKQGYDKEFCPDCGKTERDEDEK
jgi:hypothetical protein